MAIAVTTMVLLHLSIYLDEAGTMQPPSLPLSSWSPLVPELLVHMLRKLLAYISTIASNLNISADYNSHSGR